MKFKTFTLIELLIVIAVIGILLSLLMPSLNRARVVSNRAVCMSNLKQLYTGFNLFAKNNNSRLPPGGKSLNSYNRNANISWDDRIAEYMGRDLSDSEISANQLAHKDSNVLMCPEDTTHTRGGTYLIRSYNTNSWRQWNEHGNSQANAMNQLKNNSFGVIGHLMSRTLGQLESGAETLMLTEGWQGKAGLDWFSAIAREFDIDSIANFNLHLDSSRNYIMSDGHIMFKKNTFIFTNADILDSL